MSTRLPHASIVIASVALFVALSGGAVAAGIVPLAKHALTADMATNATKLGGKTPAQLSLSLRGARGPQGIQGPAGSTAVSVHAGDFTLAASGANGDAALFTANCAPGQKAVGGGFDSNGAVTNADTAPTPADDGWSIYLLNLGDTSASGKVYVTCLS
jgi:hypothetical protein